MNMRQKNGIIQQVYFPHCAALVDANPLVYGAASKDWFDWSAASDGWMDLLHG